MSGNLWKIQPIHKEPGQRLLVEMINLLKVNKDKAIQRLAALAIGKAMYSSPESGENLLKKFDIVLKILDDNSITNENKIEICDAATEIICNLLHKDNKYVAKLTQNGAFERLFSAMSKNKDLGSRIIMRVPSLCKDEEKKFYLSCFFSDEEAILTFGSSLMSSSLMLVQALVISSSLSFVSFLIRRR